MLSDQFTRISRQEHRQVRDTLLDLVQAFQKRDRDRIASLLTQAAVYSGSRFGYEEESLYPVLEESFGREYIGKRLCDHDRVIGMAKKLIELAGKDRLTDDDVATVRGNPRAVAGDGPELDPVGQRSAAAAGRRPRE